MVRLNAPLQAGTVNRAAGEDCVLGGKGINVSGVLAQLGCPSVALGFVAGETGAWLERGLAAQGLQTDFLHLPSGMTRINVKIKAEQETELNGAGPAIPPEAMAALYKKLEALQKGDILVLAGSIPASLPADTYERILARLQGHGVRTVVDASGPLLARVLPYGPFLIKPNHHELAELAGCPLPDDDAITRAARQLQSQGGTQRAGQYGGGRCVAAGRGRQPVHRIGVPQGKVINSVGAGDSMLAGFVAGYLQSGSYAQALRLGTACGSATGVQPGAGHPGRD